MDSNGIMKFTIVPFIEMMEYARYLQAIIVKKIIDVTFTTW